MKKTVFKCLFTLVVGVLILLSCCNSVNAGSIPNIVVAKQNNSAILPGEKVTLTLQSDTSNQVQYRVFLYTVDTKKWEDISNGYTKPVAGNVALLVNLNKEFKVGAYKISVWVKAANREGTHSSGDFGTYDNCYLLSQICIPPLTVKPDKNQIYAGEDLNVIASASGAAKFQYRVFLSTNGVWEEITNGYNEIYNSETDARIKISKKFTAAHYGVSIWTKRAGYNGIQLSNNNSDYDNASYFAIDGYLSPKIKSINLDKKMYNVGDTPSLTVLSDVNYDVQYRAFLYSVSKKTWEEATGGYSSPTSGNKPYTFKLNKTIAAGDYKISVWVKRASGSGIYTSPGYGSYDECELASAKCANLPNVTNISFPGSNLAIGTNKINVVSDSESTVQYRVFALSLETSVWEDVSNGYTTPVYGKQVNTIPLNKNFAVGKYFFSVWVKRANSIGVNISSNLGDYDNCLGIYTNCLPEVNAIPEVKTIGDGYSMSLDLTSVGLEKAQYRVFVYTQRSNVWEDLTGYLQPVDAKTPYKLNLNKTFYGGRYYISIWVKRPNMLGMSTSGNFGGYDNCVGFSQNFMVNTNANMFSSYSYYNLSLDEMVNKQVNLGQPVYGDSNGKWVPANYNKVYTNVDPSQYVNDEFQRFEFLKLSFNEGITGSELDKILEGRGVLSGKGSVFLQAAKLNNISPIYLVSHAFLETGNGTSALASGINVNGRIVYNMFGIHAYDDDPNYYGSQYAYKEGWFSVDDAIRGGAKFIAEQYINNNYYKQDTLYKMRWNPQKPTEHQYATDVQWALNQVYNIKRLLKFTPNAKLIFDIPVYK